MKKFIKINLNQTDSKEAKTARWKERGRWMVFTVIVLSLIFANTSLFLIGSGYNRLIAQKENEIADVSSGYVIYRPRERTYPNRISYHLPN